MNDTPLLVDPSPSQVDQGLAGLDPDQFYVDPDVVGEALRRRSMFNVIETMSGWKLDPRAGSDAAGA